MEQGMKRIVIFLCVVMSFAAFPALSSAGDRAGADSIAAAVRNAAGKLLSDPLCTVLKKNACKKQIQSCENYETGILGGYSYGRAEAPSGNEWNNPEVLALNKEQPRATFHYFADVKSAVKVLPEESSYWKSLNGTWKFNWAANPWERPSEFYRTSYDDSGWDEIPVPSSWNIQGIRKDGSLKYGTPIYCNQPVIFMHEVRPDDWRGGVMRTPPENWTTYKARNEVGSYRRTFEIPEDWNGREIYISFDGVDSFFYLWINGKYVGFSKNSRNAARFDITPYVQTGENLVAVEVYRNSDGSFLEAQDMFRLPGIFRTVSVYSTAKLQIRDLVIIPGLENGYRDGYLNIKADLRDLSGKGYDGCRLRYSLFADRLYSDEGKLVPGSETFTDRFSVSESGSHETETVIRVSSPRLWNAETPFRYTLVAELLDKDGNVIDAVSSFTGFRVVELKDTPASEDEFGLVGRYFYINGKALKFKGVNRHETNPSRGHAITREQMKEEVMMMKRANINHVRNSHYPCDPYWYYLCDKYGIYLEDEANIESHQYYYGEASLSHPAEWKNAHVARNMEMVHSTVNSPSVVIWSLGNEAGPGNNFVAAYDAIKSFDTSRPVQYERNNDIVDIGSNQYPSIAWVRGAVQGNYGIKYPFHISEYAHYMGNAVGNLVDYWEAIESTNFICGGAIWDWIDQAMYNYDKESGERYLAYGGDFGDMPNSGQFVMNGIIFADMAPKPQYHEVKKVYQNIGVKALDMKTGMIEVFNKNYYSPADYLMEWTLYKDGRPVKTGRKFTGDDRLPGPRESSIYSIPYDYEKLEDGSEYFVTLQFRLRKDMPWAEAGYIQAEEQLLVKEASVKERTDVPSGQLSPLKYSDDGSQIIVDGDGFRAVFDNGKGTVYSLAYGKNQVFKDGCGPVLEPFRAFVNNDNWAFGQWFENGLHNLLHRVISYSVKEGDGGSLEISYEVESQAPCPGRINGDPNSGKWTLENMTDRPFGPDDFKIKSVHIWKIFRDGTLCFESELSSNKPDAVLPRMGYVMKLPLAYDNVEYYGRGPVCNYPDRKTGQFIRVYKTSPKEEFVPFPKPQNMGNHEDVRWISLSDRNGNGVIFTGYRPMSATVLHYSETDLLKAPHIYQLPEPEEIYLHLDRAVTGLGGNSCGQGGPLRDDVVMAGPQVFGFTIRPL